MDVKQAGVAYEVFESLNAKGLDLTQADLIKNRLFATAKVQGTESVVEAYWTQTVQALESQTDPWVTLPEFLQFSFASTHDAVKATELFASVSDLLAKKAVTALDYAKAVAAEAQALATMLENGSTFAPDVGRALESLRTHIANKVAFHLLLAASRRHHLASGEFGEVALLTQAYVFRRFVVEGLSLGRFTAEMSEAARMYSQSAMDPAQLAALLQQKSSDAAFVLMFATWTAGTGKQGFYALEMIENHRAAGSGVKLERQSANQHLEHIMPKRPSQGWEHLAAPPEYARTTEYDLFLQRLGNLLVLEADINVVVSNKSFDKKLSGLPKNYCTSKMRLPQDVASHLDQGLWTFRSIERRQKHLADTWAVKVWPLATASPAGSVVGATVS